MGRKPGGSFKRDQQRRAERNQEGPGEGWGPEEAAPSLSLGKSGEDGRERMNWEGVEFRTGESALLGRQRCRNK